MLPLDEWQADPPHAKHVGEIPMREESHIAIQLFEASDQPIGPCRDLSRCLAVRTSVRKDVPAGAVLGDLDGV
jgi:hypothetical protein